MSRLQLIHGNLPSHPEEGLTWSWVLAPVPIRSWGSYFRMYSFTQRRQSNHTYLPCSCHHPRTPQSLTKPRIITPQGFHCHHTIAHQLGMKVLGEVCRCVAKATGDTVLHRMGGMRSGQTGLALIWGYDLRKWWKGASPPLSSQMC